MNFWEVIHHSFQQYTIFWLVLSAGFGAFTKFLFDKLIADWLAERRTLRKVVKKYTKPLSTTGHALERRLNNFIRNRDKDWFETDEYYNLSTLYKFGSFLAWLRILEIETGFLEFNSSPMTRKFDNARRKIYRISSVRPFSEAFTLDALEKTRIPRETLDAIGDVMIERLEDNVLRPISYATFYEKYPNEIDEGKFIWFKELETFLKNTLNQKEALYMDRLILLQVYIQLFIWQLDGKGYVVRHSQRKIANIEILDSDELFMALWKKLSSKTDFNRFKEPEVVLRRTNSIKSTS